MPKSSHIPPYRRQASRNLAKVTIARRVAAVVLRMWKDEKEYDPGKLEQQAALASAVN